MKLLVLLLVSIGAFAQSTPMISAYTLTDADCAPLSMLMLFRPQGFVCKPSVNVVVDSTDYTATSYILDIVLQHASNDPQKMMVLRVIVPVMLGQALWTLEGNSYRVARVTATPQVAGQPGVTAVF